MTHFLNEEGNIPTDIPKEAKELASFLALIIDTSTTSQATTLTLTDIRCMEKGCHSNIKTKINNTSGEIEWYCPKCESEGRISDYMDTKWNNMK